MIRRALLALLLVALVAAAALAGAAAWLLGTTEGARWLAAQASARLPALEVEVTGGRLWDRLELAGVAWQTPEFSLGLERLVLGWNPACLLEARICLQRLELAGIRVEVAAGEPAAAPDAQPPARLELPVSVVLQSLRLERLAVRTPAAEVDLARLQAGAELADGRLTLRGVQVAGLRVRLPAAAGGPEPAAPEPSDPAASGAAAAPIPALPELALPLDLRLADLALTDAELRQGDQSYPLRRLELAGELEGQQLALERLAAWLPQGRLRLDGRVTLSGLYPLRLSLDAWLPELLPEGPLEVHLGVEGDLQRLQLDGRLGGLVRLALQGQLEPMSAGLPYRAELRWDQLGWPLAEPETVVSRQGRLQAQGTLEGYQLDLETRLSGADIPPGRWQLQAEGDWAGIRVRRLQGQLLEGELSATGRAGWSDGVSWQAALEASALRPHGFWSQAPEGQLGGRLSGEGRVVEGNWSLALDVPGIQGELQGYPLRLQGQMDRPLEGGWRVQALELRSGVNRVTAQGTVAEELDLAAELDLPQLEQLWPDLRGRLSGSLAATGSVSSASLDARLQGRALGYQDLSLERLELDAAVAEAFHARSQVRLVLGGIAREGLSVERLALRVSGQRNAHEGVLEVTGAPVSGRLAVEGAMEDSGPAWAGRLTSATLAHPQMRWRLAQPAELAWRPESARMFVGRHCWRREQAALCLEQPLTAGASGAEGRLGLSGFELAWLAPWLPEGLALEGRLQASVGGRWDGAGLPRLDARAEVPGGRLRAVLEDALEPADLDLAFQSLTVEGELAPSQASARLALRSEAMGDLTLDATVQPRQPAMPLDGSVELSALRLGFLRSFLPQLAELEGRLDASGELAGSLQAPRFDGELRLTEGRVRPDLLTLPVQDISLTARVSGSSARFDGAFAMGDGRGQLDGEADWSGAAPSARLRLDGSGLDLRYPPMVRLELSPAMEFVLAEGTLTVRGRLNVPAGRITLAELPKGSVPHSKDVVVAGADSEPPAAALRIASSVVLALGDDVRFKGFGAEGRLAGSLDLRQLGTDTAEATGEVRLVDGRYEAYGVKLQIREGRVIFAGPVSQPRIYLEAVREVQQVTAGLRVTGPAQSPSVELFSNPPLPDQEVLTYIITGKPPGQGTPGQEELLADAALSLGVLGGQRIGGAVAEELGIEDFRLQTGTSQEGDTQVMVSGYIAPNLLVSYGVGVFQPENTLTLRYEFGRRLSLEAVSGVHNALDALYSFRF
mgnify:CR=1 FL=1